MTVEDSLRQQLIKCKEENKQLKNSLELGADEGDQLATTRLALIETKQKLEAIREFCVNSEYEHWSHSSLVRKILEVLGDE